MPFKMLSFGRDELVADKKTKKLLVDASKQHYLKHIKFQNFFFCRSFMALTRFNIIGRLYLGGVSAMVLSPILSRF